VAAGDGVTGEAKLVTRCGCERVVPFRGPAREIIVPIWPMRTRRDRRRFQFTGGKDEQGRRIFHEVAK
jgi:hypothetical protein